MAIFKGRRVPFGDIHHEPKYSDLRLYSWYVHNSRPTSVCVRAECLGFLCVMGKWSSVVFSVTWSPIRSACSWQVCGSWQTSLIAHRHRRRPSATKTRLRSGHTIQRTISIRCRRFVGFGLLYTTYDSLLVCMHGSKNGYSCFHSHTTLCFLSVDFLSIILDDYFYLHDKIYDVQYIVVRPKLFIRRQCITFCGYRTVPACVRVWVFSCIHWPSRMYLLNKSSCFNETGDSLSYLVISAKGIELFGCT